jgi:hypothetical protein
MVFLAIVTYGGTYSVADFTYAYTIKNITCRKELLSYVLRKYPLVLDFFIVTASC